MTRVFKTSYRDRKGRKRQARKWYVEFRDHNETVRRLAASTNKAAAVELGRNVEKLVSFYRLSGGQMDPDLAPWVQTLDASIRRRLVEMGLLDGRRVAIARTLEDHLDDFGKALSARGNTPAHVALVTGRARRIIDGCGFRFWSDLSASDVMRFLDGLRADRRNEDGTVKPGISVQTFNFYLGAIKQFARWMVGDRRASESPLDHLKALNVRTDRRHDRRALSVEELRRLLEAARAGPIGAGGTRKRKGRDRGA